MLWKMIFREDTWNHMAGSFFAVCAFFCTLLCLPLVFGRDWTTLMTATLCALMLEAFVELGQKLGYGDRYDLLDGLRDIIADLAGDALAVLMIWKLIL